MRDRPAITEPSITERYLQSWQHRLTVGFSITEDLLIHYASRILPDERWDVHEDGQMLGRLVGVFLLSAASFAK